MRVLGVQGVPSPRMPRATSSDGFSRVPSRCRLDATPVAVEVVAPVDTARRARSGSPTIIGTGQRRYLVASPGPGQRVDMGRHTPPSARRMETPLMQQLQMQMPAMPSWGSATAPSMPPQNPSANLFCAQGQSQPKLAPPNLLGSIAGLSTNFSSETSSGLSCPAGLSTGFLWEVHVFHSCAEHERVLPQPTFQPDWGWPSFESQACSGWKTAAQQVKGFCLAPSPLKTM